MRRLGELVAWEYDHRSGETYFVSKEMALALEHLWNVQERAGESSSAFLRAWNECVAIENQWLGRA